MATCPWLPAEVANRRSRATRVETSEIQANRKRKPRFAPFLLALRLTISHNHPTMKLFAKAFLGSWAGGLALAATTLWAAESSNPYIGRFALTIPDGGAGWLGVTEENGRLKGGLLWGGGSVEPVQGVKVEGDQLVVTRIHQSRQKDATGKTVTKKTTETITMSLDGDTAKLTTVRTDEAGQSGKPESFTGRRIPALPPAPDLTKVKFDDELVLFNGRDLDGWKLTAEGAVSGWSVKDGLLVNNPVQEKGKPHKNYGNLRTTREFEDFNIKLETRLSPGGNSGIYLRGIYEVQVADTFGKGTDSHNMGGVYSRITPTADLCKKPGVWQQFDITLVDRHVTVILNGKKIIDNQPVLGCTGGALWSDEFRPGPIYLQGDHTGIEYRNITLRPVVK